jgi:hypothetical protein
VLGCDALIILDYNRTVFVVGYDESESFKVEQEWETKKQTNTLQAYFELLCQVKQASMEDIIWISFWEGMHRHAAIIMCLLSANITYDFNNCFIPKTLSTMVILQSRNQRVC